MAAAVPASAAAAAASSAAAAVFLAAAAHSGPIHQTILDAAKAAEAAAFAAAAKSGERSMAEAAAAASNLESLLLVVNQIVANSRARSGGATTRERRGGAITARTTSQIGETLGSLQQGESRTLGTFQQGESREFNFPVEKKIYDWMMSTQLTLAKLVGIQYSSYRAPPPPGGGPDFLDRSWRSIREYIREMGRDVMIKRVEEQPAPYLSGFSEASPGDVPQLSALLAPPSSPSPPSLPSPPLPPSPPLSPACSSCGPSALILGVAAASACVGLLLLVVFLALRARGSNCSKMPRVCVRQRRCVARLRCV